MAVETCLKLPPNFAQREEVRRFIVAMRAHGFPLHAGHYIALMVMFDFASQEREFRPLVGAFDVMLAEYVGLREIAAQAGVLEVNAFRAMARVLMECLLESGLLTKDTRIGVEGVLCPLFNAWNPHLLPGFESMHHKGARAAQRKREMAQDRDTADAHLQMFERQSLLNLGELDAGTSKEEVNAALCLIMRIDRAGGCSTRASSGYEIWMIAAAVRFLRGSVKDVDVLCDFLLEARIDPKVPKGAERVLPELEKLLQRARETAA